MRLLLDCQDDILLALLVAGAKYPIQQIDTGSIEGGTRFKRSKLHAYTALFEDGYSQMLPCSRVRVTIEDVANRIVSDGFCGVIVMDVVLKYVADARG